MFNSLSRATATLGNSILRVSRRSIINTRRKLNMRCNRHFSTNKQQNKSKEAATSTLENAANTATKLEEALMQKIYLRDKRKFRFFYFSVLGIGTGGFIFRNEIHSLFVEKASDVTSDVVSKSVKDQVLIDNSTEYVMEVTNNILNRPELSDQISILLYNLIQREDVQNNLADLIYKVLQSDETFVVLERVLMDFIQRPDVINYLTNMVITVILKDDVNENVQKVLSDVVIQLSQDPEIREQLSEMIYRVVLRAFIPFLFGKKSSESNDLNTAIIKSETSESNNFEPKILDSESEESNISDTKTIESNAPNSNSLDV